MYIRKEKWPINLKRIFSDLTEIEINSLDEFFYEVYVILQLMEIEKIEKEKKEMADLKNTTNITMFSNISCKIGSFFSYFKSGKIKERNNKVTPKENKFDTRDNFCENNAGEVKKIK
jgi:hypothetical protein